jgi:pimeloyl-ACP methyl ester carboxylesterase
MPYARRDGLSLFYEREGSAEPPLLFVHGWCCDHTFFQPQFDHFKSSHTVAALDLRGCGSSDRPPDGYDVRTLADDVAWLCDELGISRPVVVGHSLGGMIAIELAARHPRVPVALVAVDPGPITPLPETLRMFEGFAEQLEGPDGKAVRRGYVEDLFLTTDDADRKRRIIETMCAVPLSVAAAVIQGVVRWNGIAALALCKVPLLVLRSRSGGSNEHARLLPLKPDLHYGVTVGSGHFHQLEVPEQVTPMMERFIQVAVTESRV